MVLSTVDPGYRMNQTSCCQGHMEEVAIYLTAERKQRETHGKNIPALGGFLLVLILFHITYEAPATDVQSIPSGRLPQTHSEACVTDLPELSPSQRAAIQPLQSEMLCVFSTLQG